MSYLDSLKVFVAAAKSNVLKIILCAVCGLLLGYGLTYVVPQKWEVEAIVKPVGFAEKDDPYGCVSRFLSSPDTLKYVCRKFGMEANKENITKLSKAISTEYRSGFIKIFVEWSDYDNAKKINKYLLDKVQSFYQVISDYRIKQLNNDLSGWQSYMKTMLNDGNAGLNKPGHEDVRYLASLVFRKAVLENVNYEIHKIRQGISSIKFKTLLIVQPPAGYSYPVFPDVRLFSLLGLFAGLAVGLIWAFSSCNFDESTHGCETLSEAGR